MSHVERETQGSGTQHGRSRNMVWARFSMALGDRGLKLMGKLNVPVYRLTGGRIGGRVGTAPVLLLTSIGRKSGEPRTAPVLYMPDGDRFIVIGTNAGNPRPPAWSLNLVANPEAEVQVGRRRIPVTARVAEGNERETLWRRMNDEWYEGFDTYAAKLTREIRVFILEPR